VFPSGRRGYASEAVWAEPEEHAGPRPHAYVLFDEGRRIGRLEWWLRPRRDVGWYLMLEGTPARKLEVDPAVDELSRDTTSADHDWFLYAELGAILSTALALDTAEAVLHPRPQAQRRRFRSRLEAGHYEIHVADVEPMILAHTVPELHLSSVSNVSVLEGNLSAPALQAALRRVALLGGRIVAVFHSGTDADWLSQDDDE
jgi:hypothetical protein